MIQEMPLKAKNQRKKHLNFKGTPKLGNEYMEWSPKENQTLYLLA